MNAASRPSARQHLELVPEPRRGRHVEQLAQLAGVLLDVLAGERPGGAPLGAEEVHRDRQRALRGVLEEERRPFLLGGAVRQGRHLEHRVDRSSTRTSSPARSSRSRKFRSDR